MESSKITFLQVTPWKEYPHRPTRYDRTAQQRVDADLHRMWAEAYDMPGGAFWLAPLDAE